MKYRIIRGKITLDDKKYGIGDIIEMQPEQAERLPSNSVVEVPGGSPPPVAVIDEPEPIPAAKPISGAAKSTHKKD